MLSQQADLTAFKYSFVWTYASEPTVQVAVGSWDMLATYGCDVGMLGTVGS